MTTKVSLLTPVGRLVQGSPFEANTTDAAGKPLRDLQGNPKVNYFLALAIAKNDPGWPAFKQQLDAVAAQAFPNHYQLPTFSNKITDGDSTEVDQNGNRPCDKEGFPGHWIVRFSSGFAPEVYTKGGAAIITNPKEIKRGDYVRVYCSTSGNGNAQKPGIYINLNMVEQIGYGEEITSGPSGASVFGGAPAAHVPQGMSATPVAPSTPMAAPGAPAAPAPQVPQTPAPQSTVQPAHDFLNTPPPAPAPVAPPVEDKIPYQGQNYTRAQLVAAGWTDAQIQQAIEASIPF